MRPPDCYSGNVAIGRRNLSCRMPAPILVRDVRVWPLRMQDTSGSKVWKWQWERRHLKLPGGGWLTDSGRRAPTPEVGPSVA